MQAKHQQMSPLVPGWPRPTPATVTLVDGVVAYEAFVEPNPAAALAFFVAPIQTLVVPATFDCR